MEKGCARFVCHTDYRRVLTKSPLEISEAGMNFYDVKEHRGEKYPPLRQLSWRTFETLNLKLNK